MTASSVPNWAYACLRIVREPDAGVAARPQIELPAGYYLYPGAEVASAGEYVLFLSGRSGVASGVRFRWPGVRVRAVISQQAHLPLRESDGWLCCDVPVTASSVKATRPTLEIWSRLETEMLTVRVEHHDPARASGPHAGLPGLAGQAAAACHFLFAARAILLDWGLPREIAAEGLGRINLMGFESNNLLHPDAPPHWHLIYYWPGISGSQVPHFCLDQRGRITHNHVFVHERPDLTTLLKPGEPMAVTDPCGRTRLVMTVRPDGGLDVGPAEEPCRYRIVGDIDGDFTGAVDIQRQSRPWRRVAVADDTCHGLLQLAVTSADGPASSHTWSYDPLTGLIQEEKPGRPKATSLP